MRTSDLHAAASCRNRSLVVAAVLTLFAVGPAARPGEPALGERHLLYVAAPGIRDYLEFGGAGILVFDMDNGHAFVRRIETPESRMSSPDNMKGICASAVTTRLYFTTPRKLYCLDLLSDRTLWEKSLPQGCDRMSIT